MLPIPYRIDVKADQTCGGRESSRIDGSRSGALRLRHRGGADVMLGKFTDSHTLLKELQAVHAKIEFLGY